MRPNCWQLGLNHLICIHVINGNIKLKYIKNMQSMQNVNTET